MSITIQLDSQFNEQQAYRLQFQRVANGSLQLHVSRPMMVELIDQMTSTKLQEILTRHYLEGWGLDRLQTQLAVSEDCLQKCLKAFHLAVCRAFCHLYT
jgi:AraC-like DNA-binding protein